MKGKIVFHKVYTAPGYPKDYSKGNDFEVQGWDNMGPSEGYVNMQDVMADICKAALDPYYPTTFTPPYMTHRLFLDRKVVDPELISLNRLN